MFGVLTFHRTYYQSKTIRRITWKNLVSLTPEKKETIQKQANYLLNNYKPIQDMLHFAIGSSMESHISHCIASYFSSRPKGYSSLKIQKYLKCNDYKQNGLSLFSLYLKSYQNIQTIRLSSSNLSYSLFEKSSSNLPCLTSAFAPSIKNNLVQLLMTNPII